MPLCWRNPSVVLSLIYQVIDLDGRVVKAYGLERDLKGDDRRVALEEHAIDPFSLHS